MSTILIIVAVLVLLYFVIRSEFFYRAFNLFYFLLRLGYKAYIALGIIAIVGYILISSGLL